MDYDGSDHDGSYVLYVKFFSNSVEDILEIFAKMIWQLFKVKMWFQY